MLISFASELDIKYFSKIRYNFNWYLARNEHGANGNPHWHSVFYSKDFGKLCTDLISDIESRFDQLVDGYHWDSALPQSEDDRNFIQQEINKCFKKCQEKILDYFRGSYINWNPCYTHDSQLTSLEYRSTDISTISLSTMIDEALSTSDFTPLDKLVCDIITTSCRHITHTGKNGQPSKKDYCYREKSKLDKEKSNDKQKVLKIKATCKRRKPQPTRSEASVYPDPHDPKYYQASYPCNDGLFNGCDHFFMLSNLGNVDTKAIIPPKFVKPPKILPNEDNTALKIYFHELDTTDSSEYILKYMTKAAVPLKKDNEIMNEVVQRMVYEIH